MSLWFIEAKPTGARYVARREGNSYAWVGLRGSAAPPVDHATSDAMDHIVSARFVQVLRDGNFSGWEAEEIDLELNGTPASRLVVTGRSSRLGRAFHDEHVRELLVPGGWFPQQACHDPAPEGWDGSSLFQPEETLLVVVVEALREALLAADIAVDLVEVGRWVTDLGLDDPSGDRWRTRIGSAPGDRAGVPVCPALLDKYAEADGGPG